MFVEKSIKLIFLWVVIQVIWRLNVSYNSIKCIQLCEGQHCSQLPDYDKTGKLRFILRACCSSREGWLLIFCQRVTISQSINLLLSKPIRARCHAVLPKEDYGEQEVWLWREGLVWPPVVTICWKVRLGSRKDVSRSAASSSILCRWRHFSWYTVQQWFRQMALLLCSICHFRHKRHSNRCRKSIYCNSMQCDVINILLGVLF